MDLDSASKIQGVQVVVRSMYTVYMVYGTIVGICCASAICSGSHLGRCNVCRLRQPIEQVAAGSPAEAIGPEPIAT